MSFIISETKTYSLVLNSVDKVSGTNNNATFNVNWYEFLPEKYSEYKMIMTFQTTGGYYADGVYPKSPSVTAASSIPNFGNLNANTTNIFAGSGNTINPPVAPIAGQYVSCIGIPSGAQIIYVGGTQIYTNMPSMFGAPWVSCSVFNPNDMNLVNFSSARVLFSTVSKSFSYDTSTNGGSTTLGVITRDLQTANSRSNTLSCFYCQNPPRTISRPTSNMVTISVLNNCVFQGGKNISNFLTSTATNTNLLTDTNNLIYGGTGLAANDMTPWSCYIEFVPVLSSLVA
jgi:hypothetical protein